MITTAQRRVEPGEFTGQLPTNDYERALVNAKRDWDIQIEMLQDWMQLNSNVNATAKRLFELVYDPRKFGKESACGEIRTQKSLKDEVLRAFAAGQGLQYLDMYDYIGQIQKADMRRIIQNCKDGSAKQRQCYALYSFWRTVREARFQAFVFAVGVGSQENVYQILQWELADMSDKAKAQFYSKYNI